MKNEVKIVINKKGHIDISLSDSLFRTEFDKVKKLYGIDDFDIRTFKLDALQYVLICAIQGWISGFDGEEKNDYTLILDNRLSEYGNETVIPVKNGHNYYEDVQRIAELNNFIDDLNEEDKREDNEERIITVSDAQIMGEDRINFD